MKNTKYQTLQLPSLCKIFIFFLKYRIKLKCKIAGLFPVVHYIYKKTDRFSDNLECCLICKEDETYVKKMHIILFVICAFLVHFKFIFCCLVYVVYFIENILAQIFLLLHDFLVTLHVWPPSSRCLVIAAVVATVNYWSWGCFSYLICVSNHPESYEFMANSVINYIYNDTFKHSITHVFIKVFRFSWTWLVRLQVLRLWHCIIL
jgi:hypothetical protein